MRPSAIVFTDDSTTGAPASTERFIASAPDGSTPMTVTRACDSLIAAATPAANRHDHSRDVRPLGKDLQTKRALTRDDPRMIERRHHRQPALGGDLFSAL